MNIGRVAHALKMAKRLIGRRLRRHSEPGREVYSGAALRLIRAQRGVGRPLPPPSISDDILSAMYSEGVSLRWKDGKLIDPLADARFIANWYADEVEVHGSQRKAAAALGISLGKLQRALRKAAALPAK